MKWGHKEIEISPYASPNVKYEDYLRGEVVQRFMLANPLNVNQQFPIPELRDATSYKGIAYLGFGGFGPVIWNNFYASFEKAHPSGSTTENYQGKIIRSISQI